MDGLVDFRQSLVLSEVAEAVKQGLVAAARLQAGCARAWFR